MPGRQYRLQINRAALVADMVALGWTQRELARRARVTEMRLSRVLTGTSQSQRTVAALARALRQPVDRYLALDAASLRKSA